MDMLRLWRRDSSLKVKSEINFTMQKHTADQEGGKGLNLEMKRPMWSFPGCKFQGLLLFRLEITYSPNSFADDDASQAVFAGNLA